MQEGGVAGHLSHHDDGDDDEDDVVDDDDDDDDRSQNSTCAGRRSCWTLDNYDDNDDDDDDDGSQNSMCRKEELLDTCLTILASPGAGTLATARHVTGHVTGHVGLIPFPLPNLRSKV